MKRLVLLTPFLFALASLLQLNYVALIVAPGPDTSSAGGFMDLAGSFALACLPDYTRLELGGFVA